MLDASERTGNRESVHRRGIVPCQPREPVLSEYYDDGKRFLADHFCKGGTHSAGGTPAMVNEKIAVIGDRDTVIGFRMVGVTEGCVSKSPEETRQTLMKYFRDPNMGLILITESLAEAVEDSILELSEAPVPVILLIPDSKGSTGTYETVLKELIRRAVGVEINV